MTDRPDALAAVTRTRAFWIAFAVLGIGGGIMAVRLFSVALPTVSIEITMDRGEALRRAAELATRYGWGNDADRSAASFSPVDSEVQTYVELEGGGREAFERLSASGVYEPYQWRVRRFAEGRVEEVLVSFTPAGRPYGFRLRLGEDDAGEGNLSPSAARTMAEEMVGDWGVDLAQYRLLDSSQETLPVGRVDHEFVFERVDETVADARYRLRLRVAGQRPTELTHFVFVPDAFSRQYADMRATNDSIALVSQALLMVLFVLLGAGVGSALMLRKRWLEWRTALVWGGVIGLLLGLNAANQLPLSWMSYDTALSSGNFVLQRVGGALALVLVGTPFIAFFLLAGESLGRRAFPDHLQQWRFWAPEVASSSRALGLTTAAYLLVGIQLGYVVLFYLVTQRLEGWWSPADALVQPDLLATYLPWLQAVSMALFASFWEESVFRAVPIACAALLGARYGKRRLWIGAAVVLQALVFAAAHANYPQQPPYARVIELTGPALVWGVVYVRFGLVPTILAHFLYDLSLISIVLFQSRALVHQGVIVLVGLIPLAVVLRARARGRGRARPPDWAFNRAWSPKPEVEEAEVEAPPGGPSDDVGRVPTGVRPAGEILGAEGALPRPDTAAASPTPGRGWPIPRWSIPLTAVVALVLLVAGQRSTSPQPRLWGDRDAAVALGRAELMARGVALDGWTASASVTTGSGGREYVYEEATAEDIEAMRGAYFDAPAWRVRLVDWAAPPEARVEEHRVWIGDGGVVSRVAHELPEATAGASLDATAARRIASGALTERLGLDPSRVREVEAEEESLPDRTDWTFTFTEPGLLRDVDGEARVQVRIAGDEVVDIVRSVRVPEEWLRQRRSERSRRLVVVGGLFVLFVGGFLAAAVTSVVVWSRGALASNVAVKIAATVLIGLVGSALNSIPATMAGFGTAQPWGLQAATVAIANLLAAGIVAGALALVGALAVTWLKDTGRQPTPRGTPVAIGLLIAGLASWARQVGDSVPRLPQYAGAATSMPVLAEPLGVIPTFVFSAAVLLLIVAAQRRFAGRSAARTGWATLVIVTSVAVVPAGLRTSAGVWIVSAAAAAVLLHIGLRVATSDPRVVPGVVATVLLLRSLAVSWETPYVGARVGGLLAATVVIALWWGCVRELEGSAGAPPTRASFPPESPRDSPIPA